MPRVIACSDSATITMQAHLHEGDRRGKKNCVSCSVLQSEDMHTFPAIYAIQCPNNFFFCKNLTRSKSFTFHSLQSH